jgi:hypothetical protein
LAVRCPVLGTIRIVTVLFRMPNDDTHFLLLVVTQPG